MPRARAASFRLVGGGGGGALERQTSKISQLGRGGGGSRGSGDMLPRKIVIFTPLKCRKMHLKVTNDILNYKRSALKKRYFYVTETDMKFFSPIFKFTLIQ